MDTRRMDTRRMDTTGRLDTGGPDTLPQPGPGSRGGASWMPLLAAALGYFMVILDATAVNLALPALRQDLGGGITGLQWVIDEGAPPGRDGPRCGKIKGPAPSRASGSRPAARGPARRSAR